MNRRPTCSRLSLVMYLTDFSSRKAIYVLNNWIQKFCMELNSLPAGVFSGDRISSLPTKEEIRSPLKTPAGEDGYHVLFVGVLVPFMHVHMNMLVHELHVCCM